MDVVLPSAVSEGVAKQLNGIVFLLLKATNPVKSRWWKFLSRHNLFGRINFEVSPSDICGSCFCSRRTQLLYGVVGHFENYAFLMWKLLICFYVRPKCLALKTSRLWLSHIGNFATIQRFWKILTLEMQSRGHPSMEDDQYATAFHPADFRRWKAKRCMGLLW